MQCLYMQRNLRKSKVLDDVAVFPLEAGPWLMWQASGADKKRELTLLCCPRYDDWSCSMTWSLWAYLVQLSL